MCIKTHFGFILLHYSSVYAVQWYRKRMAATQFNSVEGNGTKIWIAKQKYLYMEYLRQMNILGNFRVIVTISFGRSQFVKFHFMWCVCIPSIFSVSVLCCSWYFCHLILFLVETQYCVFIDLAFMAFITFIRRCCCRHRCCLCKTIAPQSLKMKQKEIAFIMSFNLIKKFTSTL